MKIWPAVAATLALAGCTKKPANDFAAAMMAEPSETSHVLVVINDDSEDGKQVGDYYIEKRHIPPSNVVHIHCHPNEEVPLEEYTNSILAPIREALANEGGTIDYIVTTRGVPLKIQGREYSVDALLAAMSLIIDSPDSLTQDAIRSAFSPYFGKNEPFSHAKFGIYLVTRLDGYSKEDAIALVDRSLAAKPDKGPFFFDEAANRTTSGYGQLQTLMDVAHQKLTSLGYDSKLETSGTFVAPDEPLMGYVSWGSNDGHYKEDVYHRIRFKPGALTETFVSTDARTLIKNSSPGQSLIADLISQGATGAKGYVSEPYTFALAHPDILFGCYTSGRNLAESFYAASPILKWKDVVFGDPLCSPYAKR